MIINIIEFFENIICRSPKKIAVIDKDRNIKFSELANKSKLLAHSIIHVIGSKNQPIAVFLPKSIEAVVADLGITYSGNAYMNLDVKNPADRIQNIFLLVKPVAVITNNMYASVIGTLITDSIRVINVDNLNHIEASDTDLMKYVSDIIDTDPYCIINTSGSTGTPKAVVLNHRSFIDFMAQTFEEYNFNNNDIIGSLSPIVFDIWSFELCLLMGVGATIVIIPDNFSAFPVKILQLLNQNNVTYLFWVPTIMVNIANMGLLKHISLPSLRLVWFAGEVFPTKQFNIWRNCLPNTKFANFYGPIEITLDCVYFNVERVLSDDEPIPIGKPFRNTGILILDNNNLNITEPNKEGELCVRGTSLAMGYYNNTEKTAEVFVQNPLNHSYPELIYRTGDVVFMNNKGEIVFKGRKDNLIKHMGYRIELEAIEHEMLNTLNLVQNCCVVYNFSKKEITLFYENETELPPAELRKALANSLPKYMIPSVFYYVTELKQTTNGKVDRLYYQQQMKNELPN